jgi:hypothetical protein
VEGLNVDETRDRGLRRAGCSGRTHPVERGRTVPRLDEAARNRLSQRKSFPLQARNQGLDMRSAGGAVMRLSHAGSTSVGGTAEVACSSVNSCCLQLPEPSHPIQVTESAPPQTIRGFDALRSLCQGPREARRAERALRSDISLNSAGIHNGTDVRRPYE